MARRLPPPPAAETASESDFTTEPDATEVPRGSGELPARESAVFEWLRRMDLPRGSGWLGGVCAGIANRLGVDPLLVRGVAVAVGILGGPIALVYALAWALLPDAEGTIHAQELGHGRVSRAVPGIAALVVLSLLPIAQGFWFVGAAYWGDPGLAGSVGRAVWSAVLITAGVVAVVWMARRSLRSPGTAMPATSPATTDGRPETVPRLPDPTEPAPGVAPEDLAAWQASQSSWRVQRAAWLAVQRQSEREQRAAAARARAVEYRERRRRQRLERPRAGAALVALVVGLALVGGALGAALAAGAPAQRAASLPIGAAISVLVLGVGVVVVALARRRSGALAFVGLVALVSLGVAVAVPPDRQVLLPGANLGLPATAGRYAQLAGATSITVPDRDDATAPVVDLWQAAGSVSVYLADDAAVRIELRSADATGFSVSDNRAEGWTEYSYAVPEGRQDVVVGDGDPDLVLRLWMAPGTTLSIQTSGRTGDPLRLDPAPTWTSSFDANGQVLPHPSDPEGATR